MTGFSADWLSLREPADARARATTIRDAALAAISDTPAPLIVDLACGTGSTLRALKPHLGPDQRWRLVDHDAALLARAKAECGTLSGLAAVETMATDLAGEPDSALHQADLVTTSAFLDLVSEEWLSRLVVALVARRVPFYAALSYDGRVACTPPHPLDAAVTDLVNRHQKGEKGFGPALGPDAAARASDVLERSGYRVTQASSDWTCREDAPIFQHELVEGWARAAREIGDDCADALDAWRSFRLEEIDAGRSRILVGHVDLVAVPGPSPQK